MSRRRISTKATGAGPRRPAAFPGRGLERRRDHDRRRGAYTGIVLPRSETADPLHIVLKLRSGYNIGILADRDRRPSTIYGRKEAHYKIPEKEFPYDPAKPKVKLLGTGGTIASRLDYRTGAVIPAFSPGELYGSVPELADICNLETEKLFGVFSENMGPEQYIATAKAIGREIEKGVQGDRHRPRHGHHAPHGGHPVLHGPELAGARSSWSAPSARQRPALLRRRPQPHAQRQDRGRERHRRGHGLHVRPDLGHLRPAPPGDAGPQDALELPLDLPDDRRHPHRHGQPGEDHARSGRTTSAGAGPRASSSTRPSRRRSPSSTTTPT